MRFFVPADWKVLIVEDDMDRILWFKERLPNATITDDVNQAARLLATTKFNVVFLDHDLKEEHYKFPTLKSFKGTGQEIAKFMRTMGYEGLVVIHSRNLLGADLMAEHLPNAHLTPFGEFEIEQGPVREAACQL